MEKLEKFIKMVCGFALMLLPVLLIIVVMVPNAITFKILIVDFIIFASTFVVTLLLYE